MGSLDFIFDEIESCEDIEELLDFAEYCFDNGFGDEFMAGSMHMLMTYKNIVNMLENQLGLAEYEIMRDEKVLN